MLVAKHRPDADKDCLKLQHPSENPDSGQKQKEGATVGVLRVVATLSCRRRNPFEVVA